MKTLKSLLYVLLATFLFVGCTDDDTVSVGEQENPDCYGVYFPSQSNAGNVELDPAEAPELTFNVRRTRSEDAITVPVVIKGSEDIFTASAIEFADGQEETTFEISFPDAEIGTPYTCEVQIDDPAYASIYGERAAGFSFSVTRIQWVLVTGPNGETKGKWRDEFMTEMLGGNIKETGHPYGEKEVEIYERADKPGYYRIQNIYDEDFMYYVVGALYTNVPSVPTYTIIDATKNVTDSDVAGVVSNKTGVWFPFQTTGWEINDIGYDDNGKFVFGSLCQENYPKSSSSEYGEIKDGILTFPNDAIILSLPSIWEAGSYYVANTSTTRLIFPGYRAYDYTLALSAAEPVDGKVNIGVRFGADVAKVKYAFYTGSTNDATVSVRGDEIANGEIESTELAEAGTVEAQFDATGAYSMVAVAYNAQGAASGNAYVNFGYIAAGDEVPVEISCGITITDKYAPQGYTSEDSAEIYIYGNGIVSGAFALIQTDKMAGIEDIAAYMEEEGEAFDEAQLEKINGNGFSGVIGNLVGGTEYTLVVKAFNGYISKIVTASATTNGTPHPLKRTYTIDDLYLIDGGKDELFKTWNLWAVDYYDKTNSGRQQFGQVTFSENTDADVDDGENSVDAINVKGMSFGESETDDTVVWDYYNGVFYTLGKQTTGSFTYSGSTLYLMPTYIDPDTGMGTAGNYAMVGGIVDEGYMALVSNNSNYNFSGMLFQAYTDAEATNALGNWAFFYNIMFEDPAVATTTANVPVSGNATKSFRKLAIDVKTPNNLVELRGHERMRALIDELHANKGVRNFAQTIDLVELCSDNASVSRPAAARTSFKAGQFPQRSGNPTEKMAVKSLNVKTK